MNMNEKNISQSNSVPPALLSAEKMPKHFSCQQRNNLIVGATPVGILCNLQGICTLRSKAALA
jgi:hypothetical protein